ncbi:MAG: 2'-5' RNA ligase family protein [Balneolales bacterium]
MDQPIYSLWLKPEGEIYDHLSRVIKILSKEYNSPVFEPHITLLKGLKIKEDTIEAKLKHLEFSPFEVQLSDIGFEDNLFQSFFLHSASDEIYKLYDQCEQIFHKSESYVPHLSLMYHEMPVKEKKALADKIDHFKGLKFMARNISIVSTAGRPDQWKESKVIPL